MRVTVSVFVVCLCLGGILYYTDACHEAVCASLVSKCILIEACKCDMGNKTDCACCSNCQKCLHKLYTECCSCVGMCPMPDPEDSIFKTSSIEILPEPIPELFDVLTEEEDHLQRWTTHRYPVYFDIPLFSDKHDALAEAHLSSSEVKMFAKEAPNNCTTAFMSDCMSLRQCKVSCKSMGAAKYRWFNDEGCCQCIGNTCIDYGLNDPHCLNCKGEEEEEEEDTNSTDEGSQEPHHGNHHGSHGNNDRHGTVEVMEVKGEENEVEQKTQEKY